MTTLEIILNNTNTIPLIQSAISSKINRLLISLDQTQQERVHLEHKYHYSSVEFLNQLTAEDLDNDDDYITWSGELKMKEILEDEINQLKNIHYVTK